MHRTDSIIRTLMLYTVNTGALTWSVQFIQHTTILEAGWLTDNTKSVGVTADAGEVTGTGYGIQPLS